MSDLKKGDMTVSQLQDYLAIKAVTDKIAHTPFVGEIALNLTSEACKAGDAVAHSLNTLTRLSDQPSASCQAVKDTLGKLHAPAFPKTQEASANIR